MSRPTFPPGQTRTAPQERNGKLIRRQYVRFTFYKLDPAWRRLPGDEQAAQKRELLSAIETFNRRLLLRPYSTVGTRADAELLLWQIAESLLPFQELATAMLSTRMGGYLTLAHSFLSQTKRSIYQIRQGPADTDERLIISPSEARYLFVYPFVKTRAWYQMSLAARQGIMDEHIEVGRRYPSVKLNTTYSFGLDDQEFVVAFETDEPSDFLDLVQDLRETESSRYTLRDTPLFSCVRLPLDEALDALGGPKIAQPRPREDEETVTEVWVEAGAVDDFAPGQTKVVYLNGQQVALFNVDGQLFALNNRCSHARGPLSEGDIEVENGVCSVTCPWHYAKYDLATGDVIDGIASSGVRSYAVEARGGVIYVGLRPHNAANRGQN